MGGQSWGRFTWKFKLFPLAKKRRETNRIFAPVLSFFAERGELGTAGHSVVFLLELGLVTLWSRSSAWASRRRVQSRESWSPMAARASFSVPSVFSVKPVLICLEERGSPGGQRYFFQVNARKKFSLQLSEPLHFATGIGWISLVPQRS